MSAQHDLEHHLDIDFAAPAFIKDPWPALRRLQDADPVFWSKKQNAWLVTRHADVANAFNDPRLSSGRILQVLNRVPGGLSPDRYPAIASFMPSWVAFMDGSAHERARRLLVKAFTRKVVENTRIATRQIVREMLARFENQPVDFTHEIGMVVSSRVVSALLGIDESQREQFLKWASVIAEAASTAVLTRELVDGLEKTLRDMNTVVAAELAKRRARPREDLLTALAEASEESADSTSTDKLTQTEVLASVQNIVTAGFESTAFMMSMSIIELCNRPDVRTAFLDSRQRPAVMLELLRYVSLVLCQARAATTSFEWHDRQIKEGDMLYMFNGAANRDPRAWEDPDSFNPHRDNSKSMAFGPGMHHCIGHLVAKMEVEEILLAIFGHYDSVELLRSEQTFLSNHVFHTVASLPLKYSATSRRSPDAG